MRETRFHSEEVGGTLGLVARHLDRMLHRLAAREVTAFVLSDEGLGRDVAMVRPGDADELMTTTNTRGASPDVWVRGWVATGLWGRQSLELFGAATAGLHSTGDHRELGIQCRPVGT